MLTHDQVRDVLRAAATARGCTDWMQTVLGAGAAHRHAMDFAINRVDPGPERDVLVESGSEVMRRMTNPPADFVATVHSILESHARVGTSPR